MAKFCSQCGSPLSEDALFCSSCGAKAADKETAIEKQQTAQTVNEPAQSEEVNSEKANNEVESVESSDTVIETENTVAINEAEPVNEVNDTANSEPNNTDVQEASVQQTSGEPTAIDKGIAIAKDKIGDGYEKFKTSPNRDKYIGFSAIGIVIIVIICLLVSIFFGGGYKSAVKDYMNAVKGDDFGDYVDATPKIIYKAILERDYSGDKDDMEDDFEDYEDELSSYITGIKYDILDVDKLDSNDVDELENNLKDQYELYVDDKIKVSKAYTVNIRIIAELEDDYGNKKSRSKQNLIVAKVNGDWGVINDSVSLLNLF